jgi:isoaspartyl peptidase/L-asparaginase-like protein (Ntn-hydrolase superfamily)
MDAGIMDGTSLLFGAVGAVSGADQCSYFSGLIS